MNQFNAYNPIYRDENKEGNRENKLHLHLRRARDRIYKKIINLRRNPYINKTVSS